MPTRDKPDIHDKSAAAAPHKDDGPDFHDVRNAVHKKDAVVEPGHHQSQTTHASDFEITGLRGVASSKTRLTEKDLLPQPEIPKKFARFKENDSDRNHHDVSPGDWSSSEGDKLAKLTAKGTENGGIMLLGPFDIMRGAAEHYKDPDGYCPIFTHASETDFHMYYGLHAGKKSYSAAALADIIKERVPKDQPIRLLGCESGVDKGIAAELGKLLPGRVLYAPNGYCQLKDGVATIYKQKPSEVRLSQDPELGSFVRIKTGP